MNIIINFMLSSRISRNIGENIFDLTLVPPVKILIFMFLLPRLICKCLTTIWKYDVIYLKFLALDVILQYVAMRKGCATGNNGKELYWILIKLLPERVKSMK